MKIVLDGVRDLHFEDGEPVRAASGVAPFDDGFLVALAVAEVLRVRHAVVGGPEGSRG